MTISEAVTKRLLELCGERGLTINKLCTLSGVTQSTVRNTSNTGIATIKKLCDGLEISIRAFFDSPLFDDLEQELR